MGMDVYGKAPANKVGKYFRNNVWWWRPLANYCCERAPNLTSKCTYWQSNDGDGLNAADAKGLAQVLRRDLETGFTKEFAAHYNARLAVLPDEPCWLCHGTGKRTDMVVENGCNACHGTGKRRPDDCNYPFSEDNVREFAEFLENCGGFEIN